jgi:hypothetical protein
VHYSLRFIVVLLKDASTQMHRQHLSNPRT